jgi:Ran GTPase-activating protein (RanGAP) involved in mRNA processing and transport
MTTQLNFRGALKLAEFLQYNNSKVKSLWLYGNFISSEGAKAISNALKNCNAGSGCSNILEELYIGGNNIADDGAIAFSKLLKSNEGRLKTLYLNGNNIRQNGLVSIARSLRNNTFLNELDIQWNYMNNFTANEFKSMLEINAQLRVLLLSGANNYRNIELCSFEKDIVRKKC